MKKILLFFAIILIFGCESIQRKNDEIVKINCPSVYFSSENRVYIDGSLNSIDFEDIGYKATINNFGFVNGCYNESNRNIFSLDILILVEPINLKIDNVSLPIFVLLYDDQEKILSRQYFKVQTELSYGTENSSNGTIDVVDTLNVIMDEGQNVDSFTIGFVNIKK